MNISKQTLQDVIGVLRELGGGSSQLNQYNDLANLLQFGLEGRDELDGHRCSFCEQLVGGDQKHQCW